MTTREQNLHMSCRAAVGVLGMFIVLLCFVGLGWHLSTIHHARQAAAPPSPLVAKCTAWEAREDLVAVTAHFRQPYGAPAVPAEAWHPPQEREE